MSLDRIKCSRRRTNKKWVRKFSSLYIYLKFDCLYLKKKWKRLNRSGSNFCHNWHDLNKSLCNVKDEKFSPDKKVYSYYFWKYTKLNTSSYNILNYKMSWFLRIFTFCWIRIGLGWNSKLNIQLIFWLIFNICISLYLYRSSSADGEHEISVS